MRIGLVNAVVDDAHGRGGSMGGDDRRISAGRGAGNEAAGGVLRGA